LDHVTVATSTGDGIDASAFSTGSSTVPSTLTATNSSIIHVATALNVSNSTVSIHGSTIANDSFGISNCSGCQIVHAENNYWGTASGPAPYGSGPGISYHQKYDPATNRYYNVPDVAVECWVGE